MTIPNIFNFKSNNILPKKGRILVSEPFSQDKHFKRSVILLTEHDNKGTMGFVLNKPMKMKVSEMVNSLKNFHNAIYLGGPLNTDYLFYIHTFGKLIPDSLPLYDGLYWGGNLETIIDLFEKKQISHENIRFFKGYTGWSPAQLTNEIENKFWLVSQIDSHTIIETPVERLWEVAVQSLGKTYHYWLNFPSNPIYN